MIKEKRISEIIEPLLVGDEMDTLGKIYDKLSKRPVLIKWKGRLYLLNPKSALCYPSTRRIIDIPLMEAPKLESSMNITDALDMLLKLNSDYAIVMEQESVVGVISLLELLKEVLEEARKVMDLQARLATVGQLAAGIAHDFNNLLTPIVGYSQLLRDKKDLSDYEKDIFALIYTQAKRASHLISQLLDFSRKSILEKTPLDLAIFLKEAVKILRRTVREDINIDFKVTPGKNIINADVTGLQQILSNLAVNAQDAMPEGGNIDIRLSRDMLKRTDLPFPEMREGEWIILNFSDTGQGIPPQYVSKIFEPFFSTKGAGKGTGLGLSQVFRIIRSHGGYIDVKSLVGAGTNFVIYFPPLEQDKTNCFNLKSGEASLYYMGKGETILVMEDEEDVRRVVGDMLRDLNYKVITAVDGIEGLKKFEENKDKIVAVFMDMVMPKLSGAELIKELKKRSPLIKIIVMSGYPLLDGYLPEGIDGWLKKPFDSEILASILNNIIQGGLEYGKDIGL